MTNLVQRRVPIRARQYSNAADMANIGVFAVGADDALGRDIVGPDVAWTEMSVTEESSSSVRVNFGRVWRDGKFYGDPDASSEVVSVITALPTSTKKIVTIIGTGAEVEGAILPRQFKNTETGVKEPQSVATEIRRALSIDYVAGAEAAVPQAPTLDPSYVPIANITLGTGGIENIDLLVDYRLPTTQRLNSRLLSVETFRQAIGSRVETLASDLSTLRGSFGALNVPALRQSQRRLAELEDRIGIDDTGLLSGFDRFLDESETNVDHVDYDARVEEGVRFSYDAVAAEVPSLLNPTEPRVKTLSGWTLPTHQKTRRLDIWGQGVSVNVASYQYANTSFTIYPGAKRRRRYGPSMVVSGTSDFWQSAAYGFNYLTRTFAVDGETWQATDEWQEGGVTYYRVQQYWDDAIRYWNGYQALTPTAANGYLVGQTFLNAQAGWMTEIGLRFGKVDPAYGVSVFVCRAPNGEPDVEQVVATGSLAAGEAVASEGDPQPGVENKVTLTPVFLEPGERYAVVLVTGGDYAVACRADNALSNGAFFIGDGAAWAPDLGKDMAMRLYFAEFDAAYTAFQLNTVTLSGGITDLDLISTEHVPDGAELYWLVRFDGEWRRLEKVNGTHPLASAPQTLELQLVMVGTREIMPAIRLADTELNLCRAGAGFTHLSEVRDAGSNASGVRVELDIAAWDAAKHSLAVTIESGANSDAPASTSDRVLPDGKIRRVMDFTLTAPSQTYQIKMVGTTTDDVAPFVVASRYDVASA